jgi:hypothetical protein
VTPGHDPRRTAPAPAPEERKWVEGKDEPCSLCINAPLDIGGSGPGKHLRKHCRNFKPFGGGGGKGGGQPGRRGSGKAAGAASDGEDDDDEDDDGAAFYAEDGAAIVDGAGAEVSLNDLLLGGKSGTLTLSDSLSRVGSANVAGAASSSASAYAPAKAPPPWEPPPSIRADQVELFNIWLATQQSASTPEPPVPAPALLAPAPAPAPAHAPAPAPAPAAPPSTPDLRPLAAASAPATPTYQEIRGAVAALTPTSPIALVRATEASLSLGVKTNTGGTSRRCTLLEARGSRALFVTSSVTRRLVGLLAQIFDRSANTS